MTSFEYKPTRKCKHLSDESDRQIDTLIYNLYLISRAYRPHAKSQEEAFAWSEVIHHCSRILQIGHNPDVVGLPVDPFKDISKSDVENLLLTKK